MTITAPGARGVLPPLPLGNGEARHQPSGSAAGPLGLLLDLGDPGGEGPTIGAQRVRLFVRLEE